MKTNSPNPSRNYYLKSLRKPLAIAAILIFFLLNVAWSLNFSAPPALPERVDVTHTLVPTRSKLVNTPNPQEIQANHSQTNGIAIFGSIIVLVIVAGTLFVLRRNPIEMEQSWQLRKKG